jgi:hypothetical protein
VRRALVLAVALLALAAAPARATDFFVNTNADPVSPDNACTTNSGGCTLHDAVDDAGPTDVVHVPANTYSLANGGPLQLGGESIVGAGARTTIIDGGGVGNVVVANSTTGNQVSGVTLRNGGGQGQVGGGSGGAILVLSGFAPAALTLTSSTVTGSHGTSGGGIASSGTLTIIGSTISGNTATSGLGGGIVITGGTTTLNNTTISGNTATSAAGGQTQGGGVYVQAGTLNSTNVTIAGNTATLGGGLSRNTSSNPAVTLTHTLIANAPNACSGTPFSGTINLADDATCGFAGSPNNPLLGALANNGGPTDTRALAAGSPAIDAGGTCPATDQRGVARQGACDIGAFEYVPPGGTAGTARAPAARPPQALQRGAEVGHGEGQAPAQEEVPEADRGRAIAGRHHRRHSAWPRHCDRRSEQERWDRHGRFLRRRLQAHPGQGQEADHDGDAGGEAHGLQGVGQAGECGGEEEAQAAAMG